MLENVVYLELLRRGFHVYVGKVGASEVDLPCRILTGILNTIRSHGLCATGIRSPASLSPLTPFPTIIRSAFLTMDNDPPASYNGIRQKYVLDWLLDVN